MQRKDGVTWWCQGRGRDQVSRTIKNVREGTEKPVGCVKDRECQYIVMPPRVCAMPRQRLQRVNGVVYGAHIGPDPCIIGRQEPSYSCPSN